MKGFCHLHNHTEFSWLDGLATIDEYIERAVELQDPAIAVTDHGNICAAPEFYKAARATEIEPIIGTEAYFCDDASWRPTKGSGEKIERNHLTLLAKGWTGYQVLAELSTETHRRFYHKPLLDRDLIESLGKDAQHLICLSGCMAGSISQKVLVGDMKAASAEVAWFRDMFPHFYIELQDHGQPEDKILTLGLLELAKKYRLPHVITNDPHYVWDKDALYHDHLLAIQVAKDYDDPKRFRFNGDGYHLRSRKEMYRAFSKYDPDVFIEGAANTHKIARMCHTRIPAWEARSWHIPKFPDVDDAYLELKKLTIQGLKERGLEKDPKYRARAMHELKVYKEVGIADFLLITRDAVHWARNQGIPVGPGRGSIGGSLVAYLIGITKIDSVKYGLLFERFISVARPRMPDIDVDFGPTRRAEVIQYFFDKYGQENVALVAAFQKMHVKAAFKSLAKAYGVSFLDSNRLSKMLPEKIPEEGMEDEDWPDDFRREITAKYPDLADVLKRLSGINRAVSAHPAGVIIADPDTQVRKLVPEMWLATSKRMCGQFNGDNVEAMGLMKQDCLGLRALETISEAIQIIRETTGETIDPDSWVPDEEEGDNDVYSMLADGNTNGVFQFEGYACSAGCRAVRPTCFTDLMAIVSLYRAGIPKSSQKAFVDQKHRSKGIYPHIDLKPILKETWGIGIYQEQIMETAAKIAGFDALGVDDVYQAIKKKKPELMKIIKPKFIAGCKEHGLNARQIDFCWKMIETSAGYSFNKSHACEYSMLGYQTARLKKFWPVEYIVALMRTVEGKNPEAKARREGYMRQAAAMGIKILGVDINKSQVHTAVDKGRIRFGFTDLLGIGPKTAIRIIEQRGKGFKNLTEIKTAVNNVGIYTKLKTAGALRSFDIKGSLKEAERLHNWQFSDPMEKYRKIFEGELIVPEDANEDNICVLIGEITKVMPVKQSKKGDPYCGWQIRWSPANAWDIKLWSSTQELWDIKKGSIVKVTGKWEKSWANMSIASPSSVDLIHKAKDKI
jgi:DNA polymerase-3 subunit alpha